VTKMNILPKNLNQFSSQEKAIQKLKKLSRELLSFPLFQLRNNAKHSTSNILKLFVDAAITNDSPEARCKKGNYSSADDALLHVKDKITIEKIEAMCRYFLDEKFIKILRRRFPTLKLTIAFDFTPEPFYGDKNCQFVTGYEPKDGTYYCFKFFTVSLVVQGTRYLLFAYPVYRKESKIWFMERALNFLKSMRMVPDLLLLDREFYEVSVFAFLKERRITYEMPAKHDSHFESTVKSCEALPAVVHGYEITNALHESVWVDLVIIEDDEHEEKKTYGYVTNVNISEYRDDVLVLRDNYKKRWGIETAHRVHDQFKIRTCCKEGNVRYLFFAIAFLLYNLWVYVNLLMNDYKIGKRFRIKITVSDFSDTVFDFFKDSSTLLFINVAM